MVYTKKIYVYIFYDLLILMPSIPCEIGKGPGLLFYTYMRFHNTILDVWKIHIIRRKAFRLFTLPSFYVIPPIAKNGPHLNCANAHRFSLLAGETQSDSDTGEMREIHSMHNIKHALWKNNLSHKRNLKCYCWGGMFYIIYDNKSLYLYIYILIIYIPIQHDYMD